MTKYLVIFFLLPLLCIGADAPSVNTSWDTYNYSSGGVQTGAGSFTLSNSIGSDDYIILLGATERSSGGATITAASLDGNAFSEVITVVSGHSGSNERNNISIWALDCSGISFGDNVVSITWTDDNVQYWTVAIGQFQNVIAGAPLLDTASSPYNDYTATSIVAGADLVFGAITSEDSVTVANRSATVSNMAVASFVISGSDSASTFLLINEASGGATTSYFSGAGEGISQDVSETGNGGFKFTVGQNEYALSGGAPTTSKRRRILLEK